MATRKGMSFLDAMFGCRCSANEEQTQTKTGDEPGKESNYRGTCTSFSLLNTHHETILTGTLDGHEVEDKLMSRVST